MFFCVRERVGFVYYIDFSVSLQRNVLVVGCGVVFECYCVFFEDGLSKLFFGLSCWSILWWYMFYSKSYFLFFFLRNIGYIRNNYYFYCICMLVQIFVYVNKKNCYFYVKYFLEVDKILRFCI